MLACAWMLFFLWDEPRLALLAIPLVGLGIAVLPKAPLISALLVTLGTAITLLVGVAWGNVDLVLPLAFALYGAGRWIRSAWVGVAFTVLCVILTALRDTPRSDVFGALGLSLNVNSLVVAAVLFGSMWAFGRLVFHRTQRALAALAETRRLNAEDPEASSFRRVLEERN